MKYFVTHDKRWRNMEGIGMMNVMKMKYSLQRFCKSIPYIRNTMRTMTQKRSCFGTSTFGRCGIDMKS
jgi:hypothetical protein